MKRRSFLRYDEIVELGKKGLKVWGYDTEGNFVCRVEVNAAGVAVYKGTKGRKKLGNLTWEQLVAKLD